jgi:hypothetical protein
MTTVDMADYAAMAPYFDVVTHALEGLVDGEDFFDIHADDVVVDYVVTVPGYPKRVVGRDKSVMVLEYTIHGTVVSSGARYLNRFVSVIAIEHRKIVRWRDYLDPLAVIAAFDP